MKRRRIAYIGVRIEMLVSTPARKEPTMYPEERTPREMKQGGMAYHQQWTSTENEF